MFWSKTARQTAAQQESNRVSGDAEKATAPVPEIAAFDTGVSVSNPHRDPGITPNEPSHDDESKRNALDKLPEDEAAVLKCQSQKNVSKISYFTLFRFASRSDQVIIFLGLACAIITGALIPLESVCHTRHFFR